MQKENKEEAYDVSAYEIMYYKLMARVSDAIELLQEIQKDCEEIYITHGKDTAANGIANGTDNNTN